MKSFIRILFILLSFVSITIFAFYLFAFFTPISNFGDNNRIRIFDRNQVLFYESNNSLTSSWISYDEIPQTFVNSIWRFNSSRSPRVDLPSSMRPKILFDEESHATKDITKIRHKKTVIFFIHNLLCLFILQRGF